MQIQNSLQWHIQENHESLIVKLFGELTRDTLLPLWKQRASFLSPKAKQQIYWDLKELERIDSAGFTLLAELLHHYQQAHSNHLINVSEAIRKLAELFDLAEWFATFLRENKK